MKKLFTINTAPAILFSTLFLFGCGAADTLNAGCSGDLDDFCQILFGLEEEQRPDPELEHRVSVLEQQILTLEQNLEYVQNLAGSNESDIRELELSIQELEASLAEAQTGLRVTDIIDPCGDYPGHYDEVLLQLSDGSIVAYFKESGSREFLAVLGNGNFQTTDRQKCNFSIASGEYLE